MGASDWKVCPRCLFLAREAEKERMAAAMALYGKVPPEEFDAARANATGVLVGTEFREDYEFAGAQTGTVAVRYTGHCRACGLSVTISEDRTFWTED